MKTLILSLAGLATAASAAPAQPYRALGTEPFWSLTITKQRIAFREPSGRAGVTVRNPGGRPSFNGMRYVTRQLSVDITRAQCSDGMSDRRFADTVTVTTRRRTWRGCGGEILPPEGLAGTRWRLTAIDGRPFARPERATLSFEAGRLSANAGCNGLGGRYRIEKERLIAGPLMGTKMACEPPVMRNEQALSDTLSGRPAIRYLPGGRLLLTGSGHTVMASRAGGKIK